MVKVFFVFFPQAFNIYNGQLKCLHLSFRNMTKLYFGYWYCKVRYTENTQSCLP